LIWTITVAGLLLLPVLATVLPRWQVPLRLVDTTHTAAAAIVERAEPAPSALAGNDDVVSSSPAAIAVKSPQTASVATEVSWSTALLVLYATIVLLLLARLIAAQVMIQRLARRLTDVSHPDVQRLLSECAQRMGVRRPVRLLRSREYMMPMVFGTRVPTIVLPADADARLLDLGCGSGWATRLLSRLVGEGPEGFGQVVFKPSHSAGLLRIGKDVRRAPFRICAPGKNALLADGLQRVGCVARAWNQRRQSKNGSAAMRAVWQGH
jgi:hypothetical protein